MKAQSLVAHSRALTARFSGCRMRAAGRDAVIALLAGWAFCAVAGGLGSADATFDPTGGGVTLGLTGDRVEVFAVALQPDGRVLLGGRFVGVNGVPRNGLARLHPGGALDTSLAPGWGADGPVTALCLQPDGKVLVIGTFSTVNGAPHRGIARLLPDGQVDASFQCRLEGQTWTAATMPTDIAVGQDGKIWVSGSFSSVNGIVCSNVARLNPDGSLDATFRLSEAVPGTNRWVERVLVQADGRVLLGGDWTGPARSLVRLLADGSLDASFGGMRVTGLSGDAAHIHDVALLPDGRMVLVGDFFFVNGTARRHVARLLPDGSLDAGLDPGTGAEDGVPRVVATEPGGKVVIGGSFTRVCGVERRGLARFNPDGTLDPGFGVGNAVGHTASPEINALARQSDGRLIVGAGGWAETNAVFRVSPQGDRDTAYQVHLHGPPGVVRAAAVQPNGGILLAGEFTGVNGASRPGLARLRPDGLLDAVFAPVLPPGFAPWTAAVQPDGKVLVAGLGEHLPSQGEDGYGTNLALVRLNADGSPDPAFQRPGFQGAYPMIEAIAAQPDGKILVGGLFVTVAGLPYEGIARLNANGSVDTTFRPVPISVSDDPGYGVDYIHVLPNGKILIAGGFRWDSGGFAGVARLNPNGTVDLTFTPQIPEPRELLAFAVASDGSTILADPSWTPEGWGRLFWLRADGSRDASFRPPHFEGISALAVQSDGRILVATNAMGTGGLVRLQPDGSVDAAWQTELRPLDVYPEVRSILLQPDGQVLIAGAFGSVNGVPRSGVARLNNLVPPRLLAGLPSAYVEAGNSLTFAVLATGTPPLLYRWQKNGADLPGQTNSTLVFASVQFTDAGDYRVIVSNAAGSVTSGVATVTVAHPMPVLRSAPGEQVDPSVAANSNCYFVAWADSRNADTDYDIYGTRVTPSGRVVDPNGIRICAAPGRQEMPAVASDGRDFFVVWQDRRANNNAMDPELYGTRVSADGVVLDPDGILISSALYAQFSPRLAFNGTNYLVVWYDYRLSTETHRGPDIFGSRVSPSGLVLDPGGIAISTEEDGDWSPTVAALNGDFLVVWGTSVTGVRGTRVTAAGSVVHPGGIPISPYHVPNRAPLAANATGYLAIWDDDRNYQATESDLWGRRIAASGETVLPGELTICSAPGSQYRSALAASATEFFCVWMDARFGYDPPRIYATRITTNGVVTPNGFDLGVNPPPRSYDNPAVASLRGEYLVVWPGREEAADSAPTDIMGMRVSADGRVQETNYVLISSVSSASPVITWPDPEAIVYGTPLGPEQLNATADVPGTFNYVPLPGTVLHAGEHSLYVAFIPQDTNAYGIATATATLLVSPAALTIRADDKTRFAGQTNPPLTATYIGLVAGDTPAHLDSPAVLETPATAASPPGTYPIRVSGARDPDYTITFVDGTLTVLPLDANRPGAFDPSFVARLDDWTTVSALVKQPDGKLLVAGSFQHVNGLPRDGLARLWPDGRLDTNFLVTFLPDGHPSCLAVRADGKILVGGGFTNVNGVARPGLARLNSDGSLDPDFTPPGTELDLVLRVLVQPDGRVLAAGERIRAGGWENRLVRFMPNGAVDSTFRAAELAGSAENAFALQPDGRIVICGGFTAVSGVPRPGIARLNADGTVDSSFVPNIRASWSRNLAIQPDGRILVAGGFVDAQGQYFSGLVRLEPDGSVDGGFRPSIGGGAVESVALQSNGQMIVGGHFAEVAGVPRYGLARLNPDGSLDPAFDPGEGVQPLSDAAVNTILLQDDGNILIAGSDFISYDGHTCTSLARVFGGPQPAAFVRRQIQSPLISLVATPPATVSVYAVEDQPPTNWPVSSISHGGVWDAATGKVKFGPFFDSEPRTLSYTVTSPAGAQGLFPIRGQASADGVNTPITGDQLYVIGGFHPAEHREWRPWDWHLTMDEVTAYASAWRRGMTWPVAPHIIPMDYVTRAAWLWRRSECYRVDATVTTPPLWWVPCEYPPITLASHTAQPAGRVERHLSPWFVPGEGVTVTLDARPGPGVLAWAVEERCPAGWQIEAVSHDGVADTATGVARWGPFFDAEPRRLSYRLHPPIHAAGPVALSGCGSFDGQGVQTSGEPWLRETCRLAAAPDGRGGVRLMLAGRQGARCRIEASSDLQHWEVVNRVLCGDAPLTISEPGASGQPCRFFRAVLE